MKNVLIIANYLTAYGGAERVVNDFLKIYPDADLYTSLYWDEFFPPNSLISKKAKNGQLQESFLKFFPKLKQLRGVYRKVSYFSFFYKDFSKYDLIIISSSGSLVYINPPKNTTVVCYFHKLPSTDRKAWGKAFSYLQKKALSKAKFILTNSNFNKEEIKKYYSLESTVVYPSLTFLNYPDKKALEKYLLKDKDYFVFVGRLEKYKGIDYIAKEFERRKLKLIVIGEGKLNFEPLDYKYVKFVGFLDEKDKYNLLYYSRGFVNGSMEDFGIVYIEALYNGVPVIAFGKGGVKEIIEENKTGIFFNEQNQESLSKAIDNFLIYENELRNGIDSAKIVEKFSFDNFKNSILKILNNG